MSRIVKHSIEARESLKNGMDVLANAVKVTLGPKGRNVVIEMVERTPQITKDGVTVAEAIFLEDPFENIGAQMLKEIASNTVEDAGDGTTTATVLGQAIYTEGIKNLAAGANPMDLKRGIDKAVAAVVENLKQQSTPIPFEKNEMFKVAFVSANGDSTIARMIADALVAVGPDGLMTMQPAKSVDSQIIITEGIQFEKGFESTDFITDHSKMEAKFENALVFLSGDKINTKEEIIPALEIAVKYDRPLLIIAEDYHPDIMGLLVTNNRPRPGHVEASIKVVAIKSPSYGDRKVDVMDDIATVTGATVVSKQRGFSLERLTEDQLGKAETVVVGRTRSTIVSRNGDPEKVKARIDMLRSQIDNTEEERNVLIFKDRLAKMAGRVAVIHVGGSSEAEVREKLDRFDDALHATRAAIAEGIVAGGGVALIRAIPSLRNLKGDNPDQTTGIQIVRHAIESPLRQICANAGVDGSVIIERVKKGKADYGYNAQTGEFEHLIKKGVLDPAKVTRVALQNAASIAALFLTTETVLAIKPVVK